MGEGYSYTEKAFNGSLDDSKLSPFHELDIFATENDVCKLDGRGHVKSLL